MFPNPSNGAACRMRRVANSLIAGVLLAFTLPLMILVAVAIRLDSPGPVFEREPCIGRGARRFQTLQFRTTMHERAKPRPGWAVVTRIGALLRYTRIDSLPQLLNVLAGDISIVELDGRSPSGPARGR